MGKILQALMQAEARRGRPPDVAPAPRPYQPEAEEPAAPPEAAEFSEDEEAEEIPFIEVGGPHKQIEASASVLAAPAARQVQPAPTPLPPAPPAAPVQLRAVAAPPDPSAVAVTFRPYPVAPFPPAPPAERFDPALVAYHQPNHSVSEQYRHLWRTLASPLPAGRAQVFLFTAASPFAGATTALLNLAVTAIRESKLRVVALDADVRRPALAQRLGLPPVPGLQEVLAGTISLQRAVQETGLTNLLALTAGEVGPSAGARLAGEAMRSVLRHLRGRFDLILVDAPPWDGRPEVVALGSFCDAVYLVVSEDRAQAPEVDSLLQVIPQQGGRLRGCILTRH
jgi:Mrp family chromosome partitioning ATPase